MSEPYFKVQFRWLVGVNLMKVARDLTPLFKVEIFVHPPDQMEIGILREHREALKVIGDNLSARLASNRTMLYQKEAYLESILTESRMRRLEGEVEWLYMGGGAWGRESRRSSYEPP